MGQRLASVGLFFFLGGGGLFRHSHPSQVTYYTKDIHGYVSLYSSIYTMLNDKIKSKLL